jgi:hypothetical protein
MALLKQKPVAEVRAKMRSNERRTDLKVAIDAMFSEWLPSEDVELPLTQAVVTGEDSDGNYLGIGWNDFPDYVRDAVNKREKNAGIKAISGAINRAKPDAYFGTWAVFVEDKDATDNHAGTIILFPSREDAKKGGHKVD